MSLNLGRLGLLNLRLLTSKCTGPAIVGSLEIDKYEQGMKIFISLRILYVEQSSSCTALIASLQSMMS